MDETVPVRYVVSDVSKALSFYTEHLGFSVESDYAPAFGSVQHGNLRLLLAGLWRFSDSKSGRGAQIRTAGLLARLLLFLIRPEDAPARRMNGLLNLQEGRLRWVQAVFQKPLT
jgi:catechol 2,3-dioxygenase-like lactoylglutathione lyase family enzyme